MADYKGLGVDDMIAEAKRKQKVSDSADSSRKADELAAREKALREENLRQQEEFAKRVAEMNAVVDQFKDVTMAMENLAKNDSPPSVSESEVPSSDTESGQEQDESDMSDLNESDSGEIETDTEQVQEGPSEPQEDGSDLEPVSVSDKPAKRRKKPPKASKQATGEPGKMFTVRSRPENDTVTAKDIPWEVFSYVKSRFTGRGKYSDYISAYVYIISGKSIKVPPEVRDLAKTWVGEVPVKDVISEMEELGRRLDGFSGKFREMELALMFIIMERLGFARNRADSASNINYMQNGFKEGISTLRTQANRFRQKEDQENNVPIK